MSTRLSQPQLMMRMPFTNMLKAKKFYNRASYTCQIINILVPLLLLGIAGAAITIVRRNKYRK